MTEQHPRRWLQFGLKTAVAVMLLCALFAGYTAWWMRRLQEAEAQTDAALNAAEKALREAQVATDRARMAEVAARDQAARAMEQAAFSEQLRQAAAQLQAMADETSAARDAGDSPTDEGPVAAPPPEDDETPREHAPDGS